MTQKPIIDSDDAAMQWGLLCKKLRVMAGLRQEDLSLQSGASLQAIKNLENSGKVELQSFAKIAVALGFAQKISAALEPEPQSLEQLLRGDQVSERPASVRVRRMR